MIVPSDLGRSWPRSRWIPDWRLLVAALTLIVVGGVVILLLPTSYSAESAIAVRPDVEGGVVDAQTLELVTHEFVVFLGSPQAIDSVADEEDPDASLTAAQDVQTATIRITVESGDRAHAVEMANAIADLAVNHGEQDDLAQIRIIAEATEGGTEEGPPRSLYFGGLLVAAVLLVLAGHYVLRERRR